MSPVTSFSYLGIIFSIIEFEVVAESHIRKNQYNMSYGH